MTSTTDTPARSAGSSRLLVLVLAVAAVIAGAAE